MEESGEEPVLECQACWTDLFNFYNYTMIDGVTPYIPPTVLQYHHFSDYKILLFIDMEPSKSAHLLTNMKDLFSSGVYSDFAVIVDGEAIKCHTFILEKGSPVLARMLETEMKGKT